MYSFKPGGGNKMQKYIPAGNGPKSGEYSKNNSYQLLLENKLGIKNHKGLYNPKKSEQIKYVFYCVEKNQGEDIPLHYLYNSVIKVICSNYIVSERYYNELGEVYLDIDYTCHGNPKTHPVVPHIHKWTKDVFGKLKRNKWEYFR